MIDFVNAKAKQFSNWWDDYKHTVFDFAGIILTFFSPISSVLYYTADEGNIAGAIAIGVIIAFLGIVFRTMSDYYKPYNGIPILDHRLTQRHSDRSDIAYANVPLMVQYLSDLEDWFEANGYL